MNTRPQFVAVEPPSKVMGDAQGLFVSATRERRWVAIGRIEAIRQLENGQWRADTPDRAFAISEADAMTLLGLSALPEQPDSPWATMPDPSTLPDSSDPRHEFPFR